LDPYAYREAKGTVAVAFDPDHAIALGVSVGSTAGALAVWFAWEPPRMPSLARMAAVAVAAIVGAALFGYLAHKIVPWRE
jgi:hypothetical protein